MRWIWKDKKWPKYTYTKDLTASLEAQLLVESGVLQGSVRHLKKTDSEQLVIAFLSQEALATSSIEGEVMQRDSVQNLVRKHLGLKTDGRTVKPNEYGVAEMMVHQYTTFSEPLSSETLHLWNTMLLNGRRDVKLGAYRDHTEPMQIVSGNLSNATVFYEAPPSAKVPALMESFVQWFNENATSSQLPILVFAALAHLRFEQIHPYEDGNGRIGRALVEKAISMRLATPILNSLAKIIEQNKKQYYALLQHTNHTLEVDKWVSFFAESVIQSQKYSVQMVDFVINKYHFFDRYEAELNDRQSKVLLRIFAEGLEGFKGGLSASNYKSISKKSDATATRDLQHLVRIGALSKTGKLKGTRYFLVSG
jgi:Fic family protein